tara:strand:+ start:1317 stop:1640 length:324 start_codon:yes stop_codon:yes gene_type:complete
MTTRPWRQEIELLQNYSRHKTFTITTTDGNPTDVVILAGNMEECNKISFVVELGSAYIEFDGEASTTAMYVPQDEGYFDDSVWIGTKISVLRATSTNVRVRGVIWGR